MTTPELEDLWKELQRPPPSPRWEQCRDLLQGLLLKNIQNQPNIDKLRKTLDAVQKTCRLKKRQSCDDNEEKQRWEELLDLCEQVRQKQQQEDEEEDQDTKVAASAATSKDDGKQDGGEGGLPSSASEYLARLQKQKKELYKNPPVLPPPHVEIMPPQKGGTVYPRLNLITRRRAFIRGYDDQSEELLKIFHPNMSPEEIIRGGAFGGTYFRTIYSAVTNQKYNGNSVVQDTLHPSWIEDLNVKKYLTSSKYDASINKYGVKCGGSLGMWESSGWISDADPYGWFQWYCRFYQGRRSSDDARQMSRWKGVAGPKGRFKSQLCNKILAQINNGTPTKQAIDDIKISPVIRQTLFHWGIVITEDVLDQHKKR